MRNVLHCYHIMGLSISATARHLGLKETAAKTRLFRARQHMHKVWQSSYGTWGKQ
jgi:DNA-directed RNA polymerase specialized sigma24 family protein